MMQLGRGSYIGEGTREYFNPFIHVGEFCSIADRVTFCGAIHHACIGNRKIVSTYPFNHIYKLDFIQDSYYKGDIHVGNDVWVGAEAFILDGVTIGDGAIIGARAVVTKNVPPYAVIAGNPATVKKYRFTVNQIDKLLKIKWWRWNDQMIQERIHDMQDIDIFLEKYGN